MCCTSVLHAYIVVCLWTTFPALCRFCPRLLFNEAHAAFPLPQPTDFPASNNASLSLHIVTYTPYKDMLLRVYLQRATFDHCAGHAICRISEDCLYRLCTSCSSAYWVRWYLIRC